MLLSDNSRTCSYDIHLKIQHSVLGSVMQEASFLPSSHLIPLHPHKRQQEWHYFHFYSWGNWGSEKLNSLFQVPQPVSGRTKSWTSFSVTQTSPSHQVKPLLPWGQGPSLHTQRYLPQYLHCQLRLASVVQAGWSKALGPCGGLKMAQNLRHSSIGWWGCVFSPWVWWALWNHCRVSNAVYSPRPGWRKACYSGLGLVEYSVSGLWWHPCTPSPYAVTNRPHGEPLVDTQIGSCS